MFKQKLFASKTGLFLLIIAGLFLMNINFAEAVEWKTITDLPGLPAGRPVTLDNFIIVLYDFLLSAVGIAAMFMIVIGGFRYLTAAGNAAALSEAKDIIYSALYGLLLAISVWVIVSTINPDLVYLKEPGTTVSLEDYNCMLSGMSCNTCAGGDGCSAAACTPPDPDCPGMVANCCSRLQTGVDMCEDPDGDGAFNCQPVPSCLRLPSSSESGNTDKKCECADGVDIPAAPPEICSQTCKKSAHCHKAGLRVGVADGTKNVTSTNEKDIAIAYAVNTGTQTNPYTIPYNCSGLAFNARDYTVNSENVTSYSVDVGDDGAADWDGDGLPDGTPIDLNSGDSTLAGYLAPHPTIFICMLYSDPINYIAWRNNADGGGKCRKVYGEGGSQPIMCPIKLTVNYNDGGSAEDTIWVKMLATNCIKDAMPCRGDGDDDLCCSGDCVNDPTLGWLCKWW